MAESSSGNDWGCYLDYEVSEADSSVAVTWHGGFHSENWNFEINSSPFAWNMNGSTGEVKSSISCGMNAYIEQARATFWVAKTHSEQTISLHAWISRPASAGHYMPGYAEVYSTVTVPALAHHYVSFDANGGSGAPAKVDKWYGENLQIPSTTPTRTNYSFVGWAKSKDATTADYTAGQNVYGTADADYTLYAVWHLDYVAPKITAMTALRAGDTKGTAAQLGTYGYVSVTFAGGTNAVTKVTVSDSLKKTWTVSGTTSGTSGTFAAYCSLAQTEETTVTLTVTDGSGTATQTRYIGTITPPIDVGLQGTAIGLMASAIHKGINFGGERHCLGQAELPVMYFDSVPDVSSVPASPSLVQVEDGTQYLDDGTALVALNAPEALSPTLSTSVPVNAMRCGKVVTFTVSGTISWPGTYQTFTLATGLPKSAGLLARWPIAIQGQANQGACAYVDSSGALIVESKANSLDNVWCFFSGTYIAA